MKNDPGLQEEKKIPEPPKPSWFQVAGDVDDFIFYYNTIIGVKNNSQQLTNQGFAHNEEEI